MSKELDRLPVPVYLSASERKNSKVLYRKVFSEDTEKFVEYYYQYKIKDNEILVLKEDSQLVSMLHLNPYTMIVNGYEVKSNYIVAVATDPNYRGRGYMRILLEKALKDMSAQSMPFAFLMPASERIYTPFDFVWICSHTMLPKRVEVMDMDNQNRYLASRYQMFCKRDKRYQENIRAEKIAEEGEISTAKIPPYMARITNVCEMLHLVNSTQEQQWYLHVKDNLIENNNGYFLWEVSKENSRVEKLTEVPRQVDIELSIGELASMIFESFRICLSEFV